MENSVNELSQIVDGPIIQSFCVNELRDHWSQCYHEMTMLIRQQPNTRVTIRGDLPYQLQNQILGDITQNNVPFTIYGRHFEQLTEHCVAVVVS